MKNYKILTGGIFFACGMMLTSCFDSNYDLSNIDTNARVEVNNLTIPVKVEGLKLEKLLDIDEDGQIKKVKDPITGEEIYAIVESDAIEANENLIIDHFKAHPNLNTQDGTQTLIDLKSIDGTQELNDARDALMALPAPFTKTKAEAEAQIWSEVPTDKPIAEYTLETTKSTTSLKANFDDVHKSVRKVTKIECKPCPLTITFDLDGEIKSVLSKKMPLKNVVLKLPEKLTLVPDCGTYNPATGILDLTTADIYIEGGKLYSTVDGKAKEGITLMLVALDATADYISFTPKENMPGSLSINSDVDVVTGRIEILKSSFADGKTYFNLEGKETSAYKCTPHIGDIEIVKFSGDITYDFENIHIDPVEINDIPSSLDGENNKIVLGNPQIYLSVNNPLYNDFSASTSVKMTPWKNGVKRAVATLDGGADVVIAKGTAKNSFCLSPKDPGTYYQDDKYSYENVKWMGFKDLATVLGGEGGIPDKIEIEAHPQAKAVGLKDYALGEPIGDIKGSYTFFAPLALGSDAIIEYKDSIDEISGDDDTMDKLVIKNLAIKATVKTNVPVKTEVYVQSLKDRDDKIISNIETSHIVLEPNKPTQDITFFIKSSDAKGIRSLDKIVFKAIILGNEEEKALSPIQYIDFDQLKITVDGYYEDEF